MTAARTVVGTHERIHRAVRRIPRGRVATYGAVARMAGLPNQARLAGYALRHAGQTIPWHRVINAKGEISGRTEPAWERLQRKMLEAEGVEFNARGRVDLERYGWEGRPRS